MEHTLSRRSIVVATEGQVSSDLAGETAILELQSGIYYGLNAVATRIWQLIQAPTFVSEVYETLLQDYEIEPERCEHELLALLQELALKGLVEVQDDTNVQHQGRLRSPLAEKRQ